MSHICGNWHTCVVCYQINITILYIPGVHPPGIYRCGRFLEEYCAVSFFFGNCHTCVTFCMHATFNKFKFSHNKKIRTGRCMCTRWTPCTCWKKIHTVWLYESISSTKHFTKQLYIPHSTEQYTTFFCLFACTNYDACLLPAHVRASKKFTW